MGTEATPLLGQYCMTPFCAIDSKGRREPKNVASAHSSGGNPSVNAAAMASPADDSVVARN
jgi:hypothetical protein